MIQEFFFFEVQRRCAWGWKRDEHRLYDIYLKVLFVILGLRKMANENICDSVGYYSGFWKIMEKSTISSTYVCMRQLNKYSSECTTLCSLQVDVTTNNLIISKAFGMQLANSGSILFIVLTFFV